MIKVPFTPNPFSIQFTLFYYWLDMLKTDWLRFAFKPRTLSTLPSESFLLVFCVCLSRYFTETTKLCYRCSIIIRLLKRFHSALRLHLFCFKVHVILIYTTKFNWTRLCFLKWTLIQINMINASVNGRTTYFIWIKQCHVKGVV